MNYHFIHFHDLSLQQLYDIMVLRQRVFVVEQDCAYLDADGRDQAAVHCLARATDGNELAAYARLLPRGVAYADYHSIGRIITAPEVRGTGLGRPLVRACMDRVQQQFGAGPIKISAQSHLQEFYGSLGFEPVGEEYLEDGIPHRGMVWGAARAVL